MPAGRRTRGHGTEEITRLILQPSGRMALVSDIDLSTRRPGQQTVFFYDGDFQTVPQYERRVQLNIPIAACVARPLTLTQARTAPRPTLDRELEAFI